MSEALSAVINNVSAYIGGSGIIWLYLASVIYILIADKHKRKSVIYPTLILMLIVVNPISYQYIWKRLLGATYWRALWMIPMIAIIAYAMVSIILTAKNYIIKGVMVIAFAAIICFCGDNVYRYDVNFETVQNQYKIPQEVIDICDMLLENDDKPRVIMDRKLYCYAREYSTDIKMMYGRDAEGFITSSISVKADTVKWLNTQRTPSVKDVYTLAKEGKYKYWVISNERMPQEEELEKNGYSLLGKTQNYVIYCNENMQ